MGKKVLDLRNRDLVVLLQVVDEHFDSTQCVVLFLPAIRMVLQLITVRDEAGEKRDEKLRRELEEIQRIAVEE